MFRINLPIPSTVGAEAVMRVQSIYVAVGSQTILLVILFGETLKPTPLNPKPYYLQLLEPKEFVCPEAYNLNSKPYILKGSTVHCCKP